MESNKRVGGRTSGRAKECAWGEQKNGEYWGGGGVKRIACSQSLKDFTELRSPTNWE